MQLYDPSWEQAQQSPSARATTPDQNPVHPPNSITGGNRIPGVGRRTALVTTCSALLRDLRRSPLAPPAAKTTASAINCPSYTISPSQQPKHTMFISIPNGGNLRQQSSFRQTDCQRRGLRGDEFSRTGTKQPATDRGTDTKGLSLLPSSVACSGGPKSSH